MSDISFTATASDKYTLLDIDVKYHLRQFFGRLATNRLKPLKIPYKGEFTLYKIVYHNLVIILYKDTNRWVVSDILTHREYINIFKK